MSAMTELYWPNLLFFYKWYWQVSDTITSIYTLNKQHILLSTKIQTASVL